MTTQDFFQGLTTQNPDLLPSNQSVPAHWKDAVLTSHNASYSTGTVTFTLNHPLNAETITVPPAPAPLYIPATKQNVVVGGVELTATQVADAIKILESAQDTKVVPHLIVAHHPLAKANFWDIYTSQSETIGVVGQAGAKKKATLNALYKAAELLNPTPPPPAPIPAPPTAAPVEPVTPPGFQAPPPPGTGAITYDEHGHAVNHHRDVWFQHTHLTDGERIPVIAKAFGPADAPVVGANVEEMTEEQHSRWITAWTRGDLNTCLELEDEVGQSHADHPGRSTPRVTWQAEIIGEIPAGVRIPGNWHSPGSGKMSTGEAEAYLIAANMQHRRGLPHGNRVDWVRAHICGKTRDVDYMSRHAKRHLDKCSKNTYWYEAYGDVDPYTPSPDVDLAALGDTMPERWPLGAVYTYTALHDLPVQRDTYPAHLDAIRDHLSVALIEEMAEALNPAHTYTDAPGVTALGGYHRKKVIADQTGHLWLFKPAPDPEHTFRPDTEHEAHRLAQVFGYHCADSHLITHDGLYGQAQRMLPVTRDLTGVQLTTLTLDQLTDIAREHLLDWALDNDDCHRANIVELHDGSIVGIDKGRAWRYFGGWPGLTGDHRADTNCALIYTALYDAIADHAIDQATTDHLYRAVHARALRMQRVADHVVAEHVTRAVAHRPHFHPSSYQRVTPGAAGSAAELLTAAVARKNRLVTDMATLWTAVYQRAGWTPPDVSDQLGENNDGARLFAGLLDPDLPAAVTRTKSYGTATFVAGRDIDDAHIMLWRERDHTGAMLYRGETRLNVTAAKAFAAYCSTNRTATTVCHNYDQSNTLAAGIYRYAHRYLNEGRSSYLDHYVNCLHENASKLDDPLRAFYLDLVDTLKTAITYGTLTGHHPLAQAPQMYNPADPPPGDTVRIDPVQTSRIAASINGEPHLDDDGELRLIDRRLVTRNGTEGGYTGDGYLITLPTGDRIEFWPPTADHIRLAHHGMLRFTLHPDQPPADGLRHIHTAFTGFGLTLDPAKPVDLELFYWRHLYGILNSRSDAHTSAYKELHRRATEKHLHHKLCRSADKENTGWRYVFGSLTTEAQTTDWVTAGHHLPRIGHPDLRRPHQAAGRPHWERFDVPTDVWTQVPMPGLTYTSGATWVLYTGVCLSTEERLRTLAIWKTGMSSATDQCYGSSHYLFLRQGREDAKPCTILFSPRVLIRTTTYGFNGDLYGRPEERLNHAHFGFTATTGDKGDNNELMVKHSLTVLDDIEVILCGTEGERTHILTRFAEYAISHIRGVPVEHRVIVSPHTTRHRRRALTAALRARH